MKCLFGATVTGAAVFAAEGGKAGAFSVLHAQASGELMHLFQASELNESATAE